MKATISLTGIFIQDENDNGFTGFASELPGIISEGDSIEQAAENLIKALTTYLSVSPDPDTFYYKKELEQERRIVKGCIIESRKLEFSYY